MTVAKLMENSLWDNKTFLLRHLRNFFVKALELLPLYTLDMEMLFLSRLMAEERKKLPILSYVVCGGGPRGCWDGSS